MKFLLVLIITGAGLFSSIVNANEQSICLRDLQSLPNFLLENDTGAPAHLKQKGQTYFDQAMAKAESDVSDVEDIDGCREVIQQYLKAWRHGHLAVSVIEQPTQEKSNDNDTKASIKTTQAHTPSISLLSEHTALITIPSFFPEYKHPLEELLAENHSELAARENWIIDVRKNGGGSDSTYESLLPWIMSDGWRSVSVEWLVTKENLKGQETLCKRFMPDDESCPIWTDKIVTAMKASSEGQYVRVEDHVTNFERVEKVERKRPQKIAVLISQKCGSSCEEFLLAVRQSFSVKLIGQHTYGSLDYSNLRPHTLPSKKLEIWYATSRSLRLPNMPVDIQGIIPDIYLEKAKDDKEAYEQTLQVKQWLEGGSF